MHDLDFIIYTMFYLSKSTWGELQVEDIPIFTCKYAGFVGWFARRFLA